MSARTGFVDRVSYVADRNAARLVGRRIAPTVPALPPTLHTYIRRLTEAAACACAPWIGRGDKHAADAAAVDAMRRSFSDVPFRGRVVIGEGEKDDAPYLAPGEQLGPDAASDVEVAVDPLDGTRLAAEGEAGALSVLALAPPGSFLPLGRAFYMEKLVGPAAAAELSLDASPGAVVAAVAEALRVPPAELRIAVQQRPRHRTLVRELRRSGARVHLFADGDLSYALLALEGRTAASDTPVDLLRGIGGAPEGMLAAAPQRVLGGAMHARLAPRSPAERRRLEDAPGAAGCLDRILTAADLVRTDAVAMALTGVTDGPLLRGVRRDPAQEGALVTETLLLGAHASPRRVVAPHTPA